MKILVGYGFRPDAYTVPLETKERMCYTVLRQKRGDKAQPSFPLQASKEVLGNENIIPQEAARGNRSGFSGATEERKRENCTWTANMIICRCCDE